MCGGHKVRVFDEEEHGDHHSIPPHSQSKVSILVPTGPGVVRVVVDNRSGQGTGYDRGDVHHVPAAVLLSDDQQIHSEGNPKMDGGSHSSYRGGIAGERRIDDSFRVWTIRALHPEDGYDAEGVGERKEDETAKGKEHFD